MRYTTTKRPFAQGAWRSFWARLLFFCGSAVYVELCLHLCVFRDADVHLVYPALFGLMTGACFTLLTGLLPRVPRRVLAVALIFLHCLLAEIQLVYHEVFGNLMPITQLTMGGAVIGEFLDQTLYAMGQTVWQILLLLAPLFLLILALCLKKAPQDRARLPQTGACLGVLAVLVGLTLGLMHLACGHPVPVWKIFHDANTSTDLSCRTVGLTATTVQEVRYLLFPSEESSALPIGDPNSQGEPGSEAKYPADQYNVFPDLDFTALAASTEDAALQTLDRYFAGKEPTPKNEYTGLMKGYNVIVFCAESFSPLLISEELTPTLYKMTHSGIVFENYYGCFNSMTTNGEYTLCLGLMPDMTRTKSQSSFDETVGHYYPFCLGTILKEYGYQTLAYHNNNGEFYYRSHTHPNMGYVFKSQGDGLTLKRERPGSDLEMILQSTPDYLNSDQPFHAYYMTYSGHYQYSWANAMSLKHKSEVENLPYSEKVQAYIGCNLELEAALTELERQLAEAGKLDNTVILLTNDHYPYGLSAQEYNELAGHPVDTEFEKYRNSLICYAPGIGETIHVSNYCSTVDILPTILNLLGVDYDSRLLPGADILSEGRHVALLHNGSLLTEDYRYSASTGEVQTTGESFDPEALERDKLWAETCFTVSREILYSDYYAHVFPEHYHPAEREEIPFKDEMASVRQQANILYILRQGLMDLYTEDYFYPLEPATVGDWITALYRYLDSPPADASALPADYLAEDPEALAAFRESKQYDAVCWAFSVGMLKAEDRLSDYRAPFENVGACLLMYRTVALLELDDLTVDPAGIEPFPGNLPNVTEDEKYAVAWAIQHHRIAGDVSQDGGTLFDDLPENLVTRYHLVQFLLMLLYPEITW